MTETTEREADKALLVLARHIVNTNTGRPTAALKLARALIACREPVDIDIPSRMVQLNSGAHWEHNCGYSIKWQDNFCPGCGRPINWRKS